MTGPEPAWSAAAGRRLAGRPVVLVGLDAEQLVGFAAAGATVLGAVVVRPAGWARTAAPKPFPVVVLLAASRDLLEVVVRGFADALERQAGTVGGFLDRVDPHRRATVVSYLPLPLDVLAGREAWAQDAALTRTLEDKQGAAATLAAAVPSVPEVALPAGPATRWWGDACRRLGATRLVVQAAGLSAGGSATWVCDGPAGVPDLPAGRVLPFLDGPPGNVMGVALPDGGTLVLPASRQLVRMSSDGRAEYAGNVTGEGWACEERDAIRAEVVAIAAALDRRGFAGPFGADFIRTPAGRRYHDLNPRINGVVDSLAFVCDRPGQVPLVPALLGGIHWEPAEATELEQQVHDAVRSRPLARLWVTSVLRRPLVVERRPPAGAWRVRPGVGAQPAGDATLGGAVAVLHPTVLPGRYRAGDRLVLGDLYCEPALAEAALADGWDLVDAFLA